MHAIENPNLSAEQLESVLNANLTAIHKALKGDKRIKREPIKASLSAIGRNAALPLLFLERPSLLALLKRVVADFSFVWSYEAELESLVEFYAKEGR